ncbi:MAG: hypothetical protein ABI895_06625 [Deltaproteobacteria bacterium]
MLAFDRSWLSRPLLLALACGSLLGFGGCGGAATGELGDELEGDGGDSGSTGSAGGSGGVSGGFGGSGGVPGGFGGTGSAGRGGTGSAGGSSGGAGFSGNAGSFSAGGDGGRGFGGSTSFAGSTGAAGTSSMPEPSVCVDLSSGLAGLPSQAFRAEDAMVNEYCGSSIADSSFTFQAICLPAPGNGQSCTSFYPEYLVTQLYECAGQSAASFLCGPREPLPDTDGCRGNECCYVLVGDCF